jgi:predicted HTH transcriptional regulator
MEAIQTAITALEQELEVTQERCGELEMAIGAMRKLLPASPNGKTAAKRDGRTDGAKRGPARRAQAARSRPDVSERGQAILDAVKERGPISPGDLARRLKFPNINGLRYHLNPLLASRALVATGQTANRLISLPGQKRPAKEAL